MTSLLQFAAFKDAANNGIRERLGSPFTVEIRSGNRSRDPKVAGGSLLRLFVCKAPIAPSIGGVMQLIPAPVKATGGPGVATHFRMVAADGVAIIEGDFVAVRTDAEQRDAERSEAMFIRMATAELVDGQPVELSSYRLGGVSELGN